MNSLGTVEEQKNNILFWVMGLIGNSPGINHGQWKIKLLQMLLPAMNLRFIWDFRVPNLTSVSHGQSLT